MSSETTESAGVYDLLAWFETNKQKLIMATGVAVAVGFAVYIYRWQKDQTETAASNALLELRPALNSPDAPPQPSSAFLKVSNDYPSTKAAERALLLAAGASFAEAHYGEAQTQFSQFLSKYPESLFAANASFGVAAALEAQGKAEEAVAAYQAVTTRFPRSPLVEDSKLALARNYESKKQAPAALAIYEELSQPNSASSSFSTASKLKERLLRQHPELVKPVTPSTNAAPAAGSAATARPIVIQAPTVATPVKK